MPTQHPVTHQNIINKHNKLQEIQSKSINGRFGKWKSKKKNTNKSTSNQMKENCKDIYLSLPPMAPTLYLLGAICWVRRSVHDIYSISCMRLTTDTFGFRFREWNEGVYKDTYLHQSEGWLTFEQTKYMFVPSYECVARQWVKWTHRTK